MSASRRGSKARQRPSLAAALAGSLSAEHDPMTPDSTAPQAAEEMATQAADLTRDATHTATASLEQATDAVAAGAATVNRDGTEAAAAASRIGADSVSEVRERLNAMADSLPPPAQELLQPLRTGSESLGKGLEASYSTAMEGMAEFNSKAIAAWRHNAESTIRHWHSLVAVKSLSEAIALSAEHTRQQLEAVTTQTRELSALATQIVRSAAKPLKLTDR